MYRSTSRNTNSPCDETFAELRSDSVFRICPDRDTDVHKLLSPRNILRNIHPHSLRVRLPNFQHLCHSMSDKTMGKRLPIYYVPSLSTDIHTHTQPSRHHNDMVILAKDRPFPPGTKTMKTEISMRFIRHAVI